MKAPVKRTAGATTEAHTNPETITTPLACVA
jgi:hypothetical protein